MANITEQDIIDHLQEKIKLHQQEIERLNQEIERLNNILSAFNNNPATITSGSKSGRPAKSATSASKNAARNSAVSNPQPGLAPAAELPAPALQIPEKYNDKLTTEEKIAYALNEINGGFAEDIAGNMALYEPKSDADKLKRQISGVLTEMKNKGLLQAERIGRKEKYSLTM